MSVKARVGRVRFWKLGEGSAGLQALKRGIHAGIHLHHCLQAHLLQEGHALRRGLF